MLELDKELGFLFFSSFSRRFLCGKLSILMYHKSWIYSLQSEKVPGRALSGVRGISFFGVCDYILCCKVHCVREGHNTYYFLLQGPGFVID